MVRWISFNNCWKLGIRYSNFLVMVNFRQILEYLSGSVQICTDSHRNFFKTSIERRVYLEEQFLINKYSNFKLCLRLVKFRQILEYLSRSVRICTDSQGVLNMGTSSKICRDFELQICTKMVERNCLEIVFLKINKLMNSDLIAQNLLKVTETEIMSIVDSFSLLYVLDNTEVLSLFF